MLDGLADDLFRHISDFRAEEHVLRLIASLAFLAVVVPSVSRRVSPPGKEQVIGNLFTAQTVSNFAPASEAKGNQFNAASFLLFRLANSFNFAFVG